MQNIVGMRTQNVRLWRTVQRNFLDFCPENCHPSLDSVYLRGQSGSIISFWEKYTLILLREGFALILAPFLRCQPASLLLLCMDAVNPYKSD